MRKLIFAVFLSAWAVIQAQNVQLMYDFGSDRLHLTSTVEVFKPDKWGNTFFFVDMEFNGKNHQPSTAYMEIARCLKLWDAPFSVHIEYNGGLINADPFGYPIHNAYLAGVDYGWNSEDFSKFLNFKVLYKSIQDKNANSFQLTGVWDLNFLSNKLTLSGFADFWKEDNLNSTDSNNNAIVPTFTKFVFMTEPQFWYNATENLSIGGEIEFGLNFGAVDGWKVSPALGAKWRL